MDNVQFERALAFALKQHAGQTRKNGEPYIVHPISVANYLRQNGKSLTYQVVGLFHDLLEDTDATEDEIREYGEDVLEAVKLLTKTKGISTKDYLNEILKNPIATAVKEADRIDNLRDAAKSTDEEFILRYLKETEDYYLQHFKGINPAFQELAKMGEKINNRKIAEVKN
ncbi:MAG: HD domain-containing protein [Acetatifactor sp.]|nr:HD domain-containing protein [Acetatifactor sp.]